jgi:hypothetical protein
MFVQPFVSPVGGGPKVRLYDGVHVHHFLILGFNTDPRALLSSAQLAQLDSLGCTCTSRATHTPVFAMPPSKTSVRVPIAADMCVLVDGAAASSIDSKTRVVAEELTGGHHVLPKWLTEAHTRRPPSHRIQCPAPVPTDGMALCALQVAQGPRPALLFDRAPRLVRPRLHLT